MNKKHTLITAAVTTVAVFILTTIFYNTGLGRFVYAKISSQFGYSDFSKLIKMEAIVDNNFTGKADKSKMIDYAASGFAKALGDTYTEYLNVHQYEYMNENLEGDYKGIGVTVSAESEKLLIKSVKKDSPADKAGIKKGDYIVSVNGKTYSKDELNAAVEDIKATPDGESVKLEIERDGTVTEISVICDKVDMEYVTCKMLDNSIGYIRIKTFGNTSYNDFEEKLEKLNSEGMKALIIDLRSNPGGSLDSVVEMCDMLLPECVITTIKGKNGKNEEYKSEKEEINVPMCVLVNKESASASEVMAGALKDHGKAILVGEKTFGKGVVQGIFELGDGTAFKVTVAKYYTPSGVCINGTGIEPDILVSLPEGTQTDSFDDSIEGDTQLAAAIEALTK